MKVRKVPDYVAGTALALIWAVSVLATDAFAFVLMKTLVDRDLSSFFAIVAVVCIATFILMAIAVSPGTLPLDGFGVGPR